MSKSSDPKILHASCVAVGEKGVLITGASGSGKSSLALQLMALGARLVSDDRTVIQAQDDRLIASAPPIIAGMIEARGIGLVHAAPKGPTSLALAVDLDKVESERLPPARYQSFEAIALPCLHKVENPAWPAAILQYLKAGRVAPK